MLEAGLQAGPVPGPADLPRVLRGAVFMTMSEWAGVFIILWIILANLLIAALHGQEAAS